MPTFNEIQQELAGMLSIPDEELTPEQREAMDAYMDELAKLEADKVDGFGQFLKIQSALAEACKEEARRLASFGEGSGITHCMAQGTLHYRSQGKRPQESIRQRLHNQRPGKRYCGCRRRWGTP